MKTILSTIALCLILGCDSPRQSYEQREAEWEKNHPCNGCQDMKKPEPFVRTYRFTDHTGKPQIFSQEVRHGVAEPSVVHQTKGVQPDGKEKFYYSVGMPQKQATGLLYLSEINGADVYVDFTSVEIRLLPLTPLPLDKESEMIAAYHKLYDLTHKECKRHNSERRF